jgi:hypothetical protein
MLFSCLFCLLDWGSVYTVLDFNLMQVLQNITGPLSRNINIILDSSAKAQSIGTLLGDLIKGGGSGCLVTEMHEMSPSRPRGCVQANYQQLTPNLQFTHCIMH